MNDEPKRNWVKRWIHFICGAILGGILGTGFWGRSYRFHSSWSDSWVAGAAFIVGGAILIGILAAYYLDDFWG